MSPAVLSPASPNASLPPKYTRILLKLSGEALMGDDAFGINRQTIERIAAEIKEIADLGVAIGIDECRRNGSCDRRLHGYAGDCD